MRTRTLLTITLVFLPVACDVGDLNNEGAPAHEFRAAAWDDVGCMTNGGTDRCYAHSPDADELWSPVVSWCALQALVATGEYKVADEGWLQWWCAYGSEPVAFDDVECFHINAAEVVCYGGSDGWYTKVEPSCIATTFTQDAWPAVSCDPDNSPGIHNYDSVKVVLGGTPWLGRAVDGPDAFTVLPECAVPTVYPAGNPYSC